MRNSFRLAPDRLGIASLPFICDSYGTVRRPRWLVPTSLPRNHQIPLLSTRLYNQRSSVKSNWLSVTISVCPSSPAPRFHDAG